MKHSLPILFLAALAAQANACATCAGGDNLQLVEASNTVLWTLLGLVAFIFVATGATIFFLWRKSAAATAAAAAGHSLSQTLTPADAAN